MKKGLWVLMVVCGLFLMVACGNDETDTDTPAASDVSSTEASTEAGGEVEEVLVTHRSGETWVPVNPQNIAVFDMAILDSIDLMGFSDRVVGLPQNAIPYLVSDFREAGLADFGTLHEPNIEYMAGYELDLIIISGRARPFFDELSQLAPTIDLGLNNADIRGSFIENQTYLGQIFQAEAAWQAEIDAIRALFDEAEDLSSQLEDQNALIIMHNEGNLQAFGPGGRFGVIHDVFGVPYVDAEVGLNEEGESVNHGMTVDNEYVYGVNPSMIFVIDRNYVLDGGDPETHEVDITNDIINLTDAGANGHIFNLNPEAWYIAPGGLQSMRLQVSGVIAGLREVLNQ
ncbi:MAG: ABC transporter substrate-binding protein [Defluviitaleaceae bacterium]|nr:ABC transporter substrate-binding protein [Defluviitaleaceae bacterium]